MQEPTTEAPRERRRRTEALTPGRVALYTLAVLAVLVLAALVVKIKAILIIFMVGILLATAIEPIVNRLCAVGFGRGQSVLVAYLLLLIAVGGLLGILVPSVVHELSVFFGTAPALLEGWKASVQNSQSAFIRENGPFLIAEIERRTAQIDIPTEQALTLATYLPSFFGYLIQGIISVVTTLMVGFYWQTEKATIKRVFLSFFISEERRTLALTTWDNIETKLGGWIRGQLILMMIVGVVVSIGYSIIGLKFALLLGVFAGLCELLPFFGPWVSGIPAFLLALTQSWRHALAVVVFIFVMQMIEGNVVVPRVMRGSVGLSPLLVVLSVLIGITVIGPAGGILAIPIAAVIQVLIHDLILSKHQIAATPEDRRLSLQVFRWRPTDLPRRLQGVKPGPAVVSAIVELDPPGTPPAAPEPEPAAPVAPATPTGTTAAD
jgi:predicted PurR-regulated permease PerM